MTTDTNKVARSKYSWLYIAFVPFLCFCLFSCLIFFSIFGGSATIEKNTTEGVNNATIVSAPSLTMTKDGTVCTITLKMKSGEIETFTKVPSLYFKDFDVQTPCQTLKENDKVNATATGLKLGNYGIHRNLVNIKVLGQE